MGIYCLSNHPYIFDVYIAISPFAASGQAAQKLAARNAVNNILFFSDASEDSLFYDNQLKFEAVLTQQKVNGLRIARAFYPGATHSSEPVKAL